jgi:hypothetical protein
MPKTKRTPASRNTCTMALGALVDSVNNGVAVMLASISGDDVKLFIPRVETVRETVPVDMVLSIDLS